MNVKEVKVFNYNLPLKSPLNIHGQRVSHREGLVVQFIDAQGHCGFGEICPLPGLSDETLNDATQQILQVRKKTIHEELPSHVERLNGQFTQWLDEFTPYPSVRFGVEMAALTLAANQQEKTLAQLLSGNQEHPVPLNGLLSGSRDCILEDAEKMMQAGYHSFKLKVGSNDVAADIDIAKEVTAILKDKAMLRLDANQQWNFDQAMEFAEALGPMVEYIEEPFADTERIPEFYHSTLIPVALDESLKAMKLDQIKSIEGVEILILKPTVIGGFELTRQWITQGANFGLRTVLSSCFESGLGLTALAHLAASSSHGVATGLDTAKWLLDDVLQHPLKIERGFMDISENRFDTSQIDFGLLRELPCKQ